MSYTKLFSHIVGSTIWAEDHPTRIVWITLLALANRNGEVLGSPVGLARIANVTLEECRAALAKFMAPEESNHDDGRKIEEIEHGWFLLNYEKHRRLASKEDALAKNAERQRRWRQRVTVTNQDGFITQERDIAESESESESETEAEEEKKEKQQKQEDRPRVNKSKQEHDAREALPPDRPNGHGGDQPTEQNHERRGRLPADWRPTPPGRDHAISKGLDPEALTEAFLDYFGQGRGRNERRTDDGWQRRFRVWCNTDADRRDSRQLPLARPKPAGSEADAFARVAARMAGKKPL
jgi:hypothetical protein